MGWGAHEEVTALPQRRVLRGRLSHLAGASRLGRVRIALWALGLGMWVAPPASGAEPAPVWVWYRTSDGCPDGEAFVSRLSELGKTARLARVGDRVDFVVTLGSGPSESSGRLERQTRGGVVAIREYRDARCEQVAEALALTLDLALEPEAAPAARAASSASASASAAASAAHAGAPSPPRSSESEADAAATGADAAGASTVSGEASRSRFALGAQASITTGVAPGAVPGGALFVEGVAGASWLASWRGSLLGAHGESTARQREIEVLLLGARVEGCPLELRQEPIAFSPCLGLDAGLLRASGPSSLGVTDAGFWSAVAAHGRVAAALGEGVSLELQVGGLVPLLRYEMGTQDGGAAWFRTRAVGFAASLGAAWRIP